MTPTMPREAAPEELPVRMNLEPQVPEEILPEKVKNSEQHQRMPYRFSIRRGVELERYGKTEGCPGCLHAAIGGPARGHNEECRARIEREMLQDPELSLRVPIQPTLEKPQESQESPTIGAAASSKSGGLEKALPSSVENGKDQVKANSKEEQTPQATSLPSSNESYPDELQEAYVRLKEALQKLMKQEAEIASLKAQLGLEDKESSDDGSTAEDEDF